MSSYFARTDTSVLSRWWWTVDKWSLAALAVLTAVGGLLIYAAGPAAAGRIGLDSFHFVRQQAVLLPIAFALLLAVSLLSARSVKRLAVVLFFLALAGTVLTLAIGAEQNGARRWLTIAGRSFQPSEILKPTLAVFTAWMIAQGRRQIAFPGMVIALSAAALVVGLLVLQPDLGTAGLVVAVCLVQLFVAGISIIWVGSITGLGLGGMVAAYYTFPHVAGRINAFRNPAGADTYQIDRALEAFTNGGLFGRGPGEGTVKAMLPDAHSDFVFAVAGEEFGLIAGLAIVALYAFIVLRGMARVHTESNLFVFLASVGLLAGFGIQALINMASSLSLIPTKGMTLPFLSYGGSSLMALALGMGMLLALTRKGAGTVGNP
ncbi:MAG: putative peptidoglycan glycosyltransferase FtsW [Alphaproteobacteria bacterium]|nr:putative peptidoglycan glycosyltransferase FtsW [Alphaproteobacteria bacterium]